MRFAATFDASGVRKGAAEAVSGLKSVSTEAERTSASLRNAAKDAGHYYDTLGRLHRADGKFASSAESAAVKAGTLTASVRKATDQTRALGSSSEKAGKQIQGFGSRSDSASKSLAHASSVADALNQRFASLTQRVLSVYAAYKLLDGVVAATNVGIQANTAWESQKLSIASIVSSTNQLADAQGRVLEGSEKFVASQQVAEKLMQRLQQLGLETTATTQELVNGFQAIIAPALKAGYALEEIPELATRAAQAMGAFQIPIQQMRTEVESLLSGNINKAQDLLAPYLGVTKELVTQWKQQGILVEEINNRLESFKYSGDAIANTWAGLTSNLEEYYQFISRGSTDGLFNSMKQSVRELQSLMITMNQKTGLAEVSRKVNNITAAWERMNDFIGNKVLVATMRFTDWIEELNRPDNLAELERQVETLWNDFSGIASTAWEVAKAAGEIGKTALDGFNSLPQWAQEIGIIGGLFFGIRGKLAVAGIAYLVEISKNLDSSLSKLQSMGGNESLAYNAYGDFTQEYKASQEKIRTASSSTADSVKNDLNSVADTAAYVNQRIGDSIRSGLEAQMKAIFAEIEAQRKIYEEFSEFAYSNQIEDYPAAQESAFQKAEDARQKMESLNESLENVTYQLSILSENAFSAAQHVESIGWGVVSLNEYQPTQLNAAIADLSLTAGTFNLNLLETKNSIDAINGSKAVVEFEIQYNGQQAPKDVFERVWGEGNSSVNGWLEQQIGTLDSIYRRIETTSSLGSRAVDDGKKKAKQIESALHSVESELNRLQMTDAQFKQWQVNEKVEKLEKLLGASNPKVIELRAALEKELHDNILKDILSYADPAAAAVAKVDKEYEAFLRNVEYLKKTDPAKYTQLMTKAETEHEKALRKAERASKEQNEHTHEKLQFYKELEELTGQYGLSLKYQNELLAQQVELWRDADIPEEYINKMRELRELQMSRDWSDGARRGLLEYQASASDTAKGVEESFKGLFSGMDSGWRSAWEQMIEDGKVSLSSFRSVFASFLADLMHMAITRPITVKIAGVVSGMLGTGGVAYAAGGVGNGGSGGMGLGNMPFSSLLPDSWTSGISSFMGYELPGTAPGISGLYGPTMDGGNLASGLSLGSALMYGGLGSLGYSLLGGALGLPQNKYSGITSGLGAGLGAWGASAALSGTSLGATLGSAVPVVGTVIGAALGGLASSLFGGGKKTHPSVYTNVVDASLFGSDWEALMTQGAWTDRASVSDAAGIFRGLGEVANTTAGSIMGFAQALPEEYQAQVLARLNAETVSFGRGSTAGRKGVTDYGPSTWNFQFHDEEQLREVINTAGEDIQRVMLNALQRAMAGTDLSSMLTMDLSSTEGLDKAIQAVNAINTVTEATANIKEPLSEMEQQAKAARAQLDEWTESMRSLGVNADYAGKLMEDYRHAYIDNVIATLDESLHPLSAYAQAVKGANEAVDQRKKALEIIGATEGQLAQVEAMRAEVVKQATEEMLRSFDQSVAQRWAALDGTSDEVGRAISQENELREAIRQFGEGSAQVAELLKLQAAEAATAGYESLKSQMDALEQQRVQLQQQAIQEQINAINEQISTAKALKSTWEGLDKSLSQSRYNLFAGSANIDAENRLGTVETEFRRLSGLALGGDSDAAGQLAGVGTSLLDLVRQTAGTEEEYLDAFWAVNAQLKSAQDAAGAQVSAADKQLEALQGQLDVQNAALEQLQGQSATLEEIEKQIAELKPLLDAAANKAGIKAFAGGGLALPGWAVVGEEGPELVNFSQPGRVYTAADTAALFRSATPRATAVESGGSREEARALRQEVYELRRDMNILLNEIAKYGRRTSDAVEAWDAEGMPGVRA